MIRTLKDLLCMIAQTIFEETGFYTLNIEWESCSGFLFLINLFVKHKFSNLKVSFEIFIQGRFKVTSASQANKLLNFSCFSHTSGVSIFLSCLISFKMFFSQNGFMLFLRPTLGYDRYQGFESQEIKKKHSYGLDGKPR